MIEITEINSRCQTWEFASTHENREVSTLEANDRTVIRVVDETHSSVMVLIGSVLIARQQPRHCLITLRTGLLGLPPRLGQPKLPF